MVNSITLRKKVRRAWRITATGLSAHAMTRDKASSLCGIPDIRLVKAAVTPTGVSYRVGCYRCYGSLGLIEELASMTPKQVKVLRLSKAGIRLVHCGEVKRTERL